MEVVGLVATCSRSVSTVDELLIWPPHMPAVTTEVGEGRYGGSEDVRLLEAEQSTTGWVGEKSMRPAGSRHWWSWSLDLSLEH